MLDSRKLPAKAVEVGGDDSCVLLFSCHCQDTCEQIIGILHENAKSLEVDFKNCGNAGGLGWLRLVRK